MPTRPLVALVTNSITRYTDRKHTRSATPEEMALEHVGCLSKIFRNKAGCGEIAIRDWGRNVRGASNRKHCRAQRPFGTYFQHFANDVVAESATSLRKRTAKFCPDRCLIWIVSDLQTDCPEPIGVHISGQRAQTGNKTGSAANHNALTAAALRGLIRGETGGGRGPWQRLS